MIFIILLAITAIIIVFIGIAIKKNKKVALQGVIECREYRVASKIAGKIETLHISEGDSVTIFGAENNVSQMAAVLGTIPYEVMTNISKRVKRVYIKE